MKALLYPTVIFLLIVGMIGFLAYQLINDAVTAHLLESGNE